MKRIHSSLDHTHGVVGLHQPEPRRPKRRCSALLSPAPADERPHSSYLLQPTELPRKRSCREDNRLHEWLDSIPEWTDTHREDKCRSANLEQCARPLLAPRAQSASAMSIPNAFGQLPTPSTTGSSVIEGDRFQGRPLSQSYQYPQTPAAYSQHSAPSEANTSRTDSSKDLVKQPLYRTVNLANNNIILRDPYEPLPQSLEPLLAQVRANRDTPSPDYTQVDRDLCALERGASESAVKSYLRRTIFPERIGVLNSSEDLLMNKRHVPRTSPVCPVSTPKPDYAYGYGRHEAFPNIRHQQQMVKMDGGREMSANSEDLLYPFFVIKVKGDGPSGQGSLWVATNQCLGGASTCVKMAEDLNARLRACGDAGVRQVNNAAFSVVASGTEGRLYISWKADDLCYYQQRVQSYLLQDGEMIWKFRCHAKNIFDWGRTERLKGIHDAMDFLLEASQSQSSKRPLHVGAAATPPPASKRRLIPPQTAPLETYVDPKTQGTYYVDEAGPHWVSFS